MGLFGKKKMEMTLNSYNYSPGDDITGTINLNLKKPVNARGLFIRLKGEESATESYTDSEGNRRTRTVWNKIFDTKLPLDGEREYTGGAFQIDMKIPEDVARGGGAKRWFVIANLDIPRRLDIKKKVQVNIG